MPLLSPLRRQATSGAYPGRSPGHLRLASALAGLAAVLLFMLVPTLARADSATTLNIVGTSDVSDSGLMQNIIIPGFTKAFPQFGTPVYHGSATGAAITAAETGNGGPSVLIVHAASLENQFVAGGYSYNNQYGNAIFTNDFILAGPKNDPAGVTQNAGSNIAQAFADVATAGAAGTAVFESRGGDTSASGTTVEEHEIWQLVSQAGLTPSGVVLCNVSAADGGGMAPVNPTDQPTSGQTCPDSGTVETAASAPSWYKVNTGASQAANVIATNVCASPGTSTPTSNANPPTTPPATDCYSLTDRGTFDYLLSQQTSSIPSLQISTRNNLASAPGGQFALINYFHAYIINPSKPGETVNLTGAQDFINYLTSPATQTQISTYLALTRGALDTGPPPFVPDASPSLTATALPASVTAGQAVTVSGQLTNAEPGYPALAGKTVSVDEVEGGLPVPVANGTTNATGGYTITFSPPSSGSYEVATGQISQVEDASLNPVFGDILSPASTAATPIAVQATASITTATATPATVNVAGAIGPAAPDANGTVTLLSRPAGSNSAFTAIATTPLALGQTSYALSGSVAAGGSKTLVVQYTDPGGLTTGTSAPTTLTVPASALKVSFKKVKLAKNKLTVTGALGQAATGTGTKVRLYALDLGQVVKTKATKKTKKASKKHKPTTKKTGKAVRLVADAATAGRFKKVAVASVKAGATTYTIKHTFTKGHKYVLQLEFVNKGQTSTYSGYRYITVKQ